MKKQNKEVNPLEYEDYGNAAMYIFSILSIIIMVGLLILFAIFVASGMFFISEIIL